MKKRSKLEKKLDGVTLSFTDKICYFPCIVGRADTEYPDHYWWRFKRPPSNTLYIACANRSYKEIMENLFHAMMEKDRPKINFFKIDTRIRKFMYDKIFVPNKEWIQRNQYRR